MSICNEIKISNTSNTYHIIECKSENSSNFDSVWRVSSLAAELNRERRRAKKNQDLDWDKNLSNVSIYQY